MAQLLREGFQPRNQDDFLTLSSGLFNQTLLKVKERYFRLLEVEYYLNSPEHPDTYTHCDPIQTEYGSLYFHRLNGKSYKSGTFKCMDLTLGSRPSVEGEPVVPTYCGVLLRAMIEVTVNVTISPDENTSLVATSYHGEPVVGPCKCVDRLLAEFGCQNIREYEAQRRNSRLTMPPRILEDPEISLVPADLEESPHNTVRKFNSLWVGRRIGLGPREPAFRELPYRHLIHKEWARKEKTALQVVSLVGSIL